MRIAIYGSGAIGTVLGSLLSEKGNQVDLFTRNTAHVEALQQKGATIVGNMKKHIPVNAFSANHLIEQYDLIFLATKVLENKEVVPLLKEHLREKGIVCTLQNGVPEPLLVEILGPKAVVGCAVGWGATLLEAGVVELTSAADAMVFNLGFWEGGDENNVKTVAQLLSTVGTAVIESNFIGARWTKLLVNAAFSGMATVIGTPYAGVIDNKEARMLALCIIKECIDVAKASEIQLEPIQGKDVASLFDYRTRFKKFFAFHLIPLAMRKHRALKPSMLQDYERGRKTEIDAINGAVCHQAAQVGIRAEVNEKVVELIHAFEAKTATPSLSNIAAFEHLACLQVRRHI